MIATFNRSPVDDGYCRGLDFFNSGGIWLICIGQKTQL
jgi:hypothetical protein